MENSFPHHKLARWYAGNKRDLPWRKNQDPYRIWVAEIMLQQTQVENVIPYYLRFLKRFPSVKSLARAREESVLALWSGLGFYTRARNLLKSARQIVRNGTFPNSFEALLELPGIGPYTAGAIASIAHDIPAAIFDGNVRRVLSRFYASNDENFLKSRAQESVLAARQSGIQPSRFNQALMELGALICAPKKPSCHCCPLAVSCEAKKKGLQGSYPRIHKRPSTIVKKYALGLLSLWQSPKKFLILRRSSRKRWLKGLWEFPMVFISASATLQSVAKKMSESLGVPVEIAEKLGQIRHSITHHQLSISVFIGRLPGVKGPIPKNARWASPSGLKNLSASSILRKAFALR